MAQARFSVIVGMAPWFGAWLQGYKRRVEAGVTELDVGFVHFMIHLGVEVRADG